MESSKKPRHGKTPEKEIKPMGIAGKELSADDFTDELNLRIDQGIKTFREDRNQSERSVVMEKMILLIQENPLIRKYFSIIDTRENAKERIDDLRQMIEVAIEDGNKTAEEKFMTLNYTKKLRFLEKHLPDYEAGVEEFLNTNKEKLGPLLITLEEYQKRIIELDQKLKATYSKPVGLN